MQRIEKLVPLALSSVPAAKPDTPFARVTRVAPGSLAAISGLCPGDLLVSFGSLMKQQVSNSSSLRLLVTELDAHRNGVLPARLLRGGVQVMLSVDLSKVPSSSPIQLGYTFLFPAIHNFYAIGFM